MPIIYSHQPDDIITPPAPLRIDDDSSGWWAGTQRCFASVALATVIAATSLTTVLAEKIQQQPEEIVVPAGPLRVTDDYWQSPLYQKQLSLALPTTQRLPYLPDPDDLLAGNLFGVADDSVWATVIAPGVAALQWAQPWRFDQQEVPLAIAGTPATEDYWLSSVPSPSANAVSASILTQLHICDAADVVSFSASFTPDEDFWSAAQPALSQAACFLSTLTWTQPFAFDAPDLGVISPTQVDEDYWLPSSALPVTTYHSSSVSFPLGVVQDQAEFVLVLPAASVDQDFWLNALIAASLGTQTSPQPATQLWSDTDFIVTPPFVSEDYWPCPPPLLQSGPGTGAGTQPWSDADFAFVPAPIFDEDFWSLFRSVPQWLRMNPVAASWPLWIGDGEEIAGPMPAKIPGPYWIRHDGHLQGLFWRTRWR